MHKQEKKEILEMLAATKEIIESYEEPAYDENIPETMFLKTRLTGLDDNGWYIRHGDYNKERGLGVTKLSAYEDTELTPEGVEFLKGENERLKKQCGWIKIDPDTLPLPFMRVLLYEKGKSIATGGIAYITDSDLSPTNGHGVWKNTHGKIINPTHWMPLPQPPND
jgi:hypothetical protein